MTIRSDMFEECEERTVAFTRECGGVVRLTPEQLAGDLNDLLAEARIGCCQKCGCLEATARIEGEYVVARCRVSPGVRALGDRIEPDPGRIK